MIWLDDWKLLALAAAGLWAVPAMGSFPLATELTVVMEQRCLECHNGEKAKGDLDLEALMAEPNNPELWKAIQDEVAAGDMPPKKEGPLSSEERGFLLNHLPEFEAMEMSRLMTPSELNYTLIDFYGVDEDSFNAETLLRVNYSNDEYWTQQKEVISPYYLDDLYEPLGTAINALVHAREVQEAKTISAMVNQAGHMARTFNVKLPGGQKKEVGDLRWFWQGKSSGLMFQYPGEEKSNVLPAGTYQVELDLETPNYGKPFKDPRLAQGFGVLKDGGKFEIAFYTRNKDSIGAAKIFKVVEVPTDRQKVLVEVELKRAASLAVGLVKGPSGGSFKYLVDD